MVEAFEEEMAAMTIAQAMMGHVARQKVQAMKEQRNVDIAAAAAEFEPPVKTHGRLGISACIALALAIFFVPLLSQQQAAYVTPAPLLLAAPAPPPPFRRGLLPSPPAAVHALVAVPAAGALTLVRALTGTDYGLLLQAAAALAALWLLIGRLFGTAESGDTKPRRAARTATNTTMTETDTTTTETTTTTTTRIRLNSAGQPIDARTGRFVSRATALAHGASASTTTATSSQWNDTQRALGGKGLSRPEISLLYHALKGKHTDWDAFRSHVKGKGLSRERISKLYATLKPLAAARAAKAAAGA